MSHPKQYEPGQTVRASFTFKDLDADQKKDPSTVWVTLYHPRTSTNNHYKYGENYSDASLTKPTDDQGADIPGEFEFEKTFTLADPAGTWEIRGLGTGAVEASDVIEIELIKQEFEEPS